jgi:tripartite-type tricarboxylate transporter receptor subunit TctC
MKHYLVVLLAFLIVATVFAGGGAQGSNPASGYPNRPVEILIPGNPGSGADTGARAIAPTLEKYLGVPVVLINEPTANGEVALTKLKNARIDGYTWLTWNSAAVAMRCVVGNLKGVVNVLTDYVYPGGYAIDPLVILTQKNGPYKTIDDVVKAAKANPGKITWGRMGPISADSVLIDYLEANHGVKFNPVDGMDTSDTVTAIMGGHLDIMCDQVSSSLQTYLDGAIEIIGVGGDARISELPNIATFNGQGYDFPYQANERHFYGPSGVPEEIFNIFSEALRKAINDPEFIERCKNVNMFHWYGNPETALRNMQSFVEAYEALK